MEYIREIEYGGIKMWQVVADTAGREEKNKVIEAFTSEADALRFLWKRERPEKKVDRETIAALSLMLGDWTVSDKCKKYIRKAIGYLEGAEEE